MRPTSAYALLGMLALGPGSGYDLKRRVEGSVAHFWSESYGQIYPMLARLAAEGLVAPRVERGRGRPHRRAYAITEQGRRALARWLAEPARTQGFRNELLLKLFLGRHQAVAESARHVERFQRQQQALAERYAALEARLRRDHAAHPDLPYWLMTLRFGQHRATALRAWTDETLVALGRLEGGDRSTLRKRGRPADGHAGGAAPLDPRARRDARAGRRARRDADGQ